jgi:hypothetical protein
MRVLLIVEGQVGGQARARIARVGIVVQVDLIAEIETIAQPTHQALLHVSGGWQLKHREIYQREGRCSQEGL